MTHRYHDITVSQFFENGVDELIEEATGSLLALGFYQAGTLCNNFKSRTIKTMKKRIRKTINKIAGKCKKSKLLAQTKRTTAQIITGILASSLILFLSAGSAI